ncbi:unnamed protein product [Danaus chrysippus]|uniref:(African queen) hypothetical protein n=1 Tax=Danaus chrysippus TaxID=151541 RepID=A0A8J2W945_9NEOP|nr:unnamed protein product [Danaus chrysippus]
MSEAGFRGGRRIPTPFPPPKDLHQNRSSLRLVGSDASYKLSPYEMEALNAMSVYFVQGVFLHICCIELICNTPQSINISSSDNHLDKFTLPHCLFDLCFGSTLALHRCTSRPLLSHSKSRFRDGVS